jgi:predicted MFS family arabinose efflux permease
MSTAVANPVRPRRSRISIVLGTLLRILLFAITCTGLGMAFGLFTGIVVQVVRSLVHRGAIDMTVAYRFYGIPLAAVCGVGALLVFTVIETRTARRLLASR